MRCYALLIQRTLQTTAQGVGADFSHKGHACPERSRRAGAVGSAAPDGFDHGRNRGFAVLEEIIADGEIGRLHVAVDVAHDAQ